MAAREAQGCWLGHQAPEEVFAGAKYNGVGAWGQDDRGNIGTLFYLALPKEILIRSDAFRFQGDGRCL